MTATDQLKLASTLSQIAAVPAGMLGPIGTYAYSKTFTPHLSDDERYALIGRGALGGSIGGLLGTGLGWGVSASTGVPILPSMLLGAGLGAMGGGMATGFARRRQILKRKRKEHDDEEKKQASLTVSQQVQLAQMIKLAGPALNKFLGRAAEVTELGGPFNAGLMDRIAQMMAPAGAIGGSRTYGPAQRLAEVAKSRLPADRTNVAKSLLALRKGGDVARVNQLSTGNVPNYFAQLFQ